MKPQEMSIFTFSEKEKRVYLASPYTDKDEKIMLLRYERAVQTAGDLFIKGYLVFSPIAHCHPIATRHFLPGDYSFWKKYSDSFLVHWAEAVLVLCLPGTEESVGVQAEIEIAKELKLPIYSI